MDGRLNLMDVHTQPMYRGSNNVGTTSSHQQRPDFNFNQQQLPYRKGFSKEEKNTKYSFIMGGNISSLINPTNDVTTQNYNSFSHGEG